MFNAYRGDCYFGCGSKANIVAYGVFGLLFALGFSLLVPGGLFISTCEASAVECLKPGHLWCSQSLVKSIVGDLGSVPSGLTAAMTNGNHLPLGRLNDDTNDISGWSAWQIAQVGTTGRLNAASRDNFQRLVSWVNTGTNSGKCLYGDTFDFHDLLGIDFEDFYNNDFDHQTASERLMTYTFTQAYQSNGLNYYWVSEGPQLCNFLNYDKNIDFTGTGTVSNHFDEWQVARTHCNKCEYEYNACVDLGTSLFVIGWIAVFFAIFPLIFMCCCSPDPRKTNPQ